MTQEDKSLLLKDICARLPYGVKVTNGIHTITLTPCSDTSIIIKNEHILPYLRPMSSMTEEEKIELSCLFGGIPDDDYIYKPYTDIPYSTFDEVIDWLNAHHFDFRNLIEKVLAIEAPKGMYNIKEK